MCWDWDEGEKTCLDLDDLGPRLYFLIFGHLIKKEFGFTWHLKQKKVTK